MWTSVIKEAYILTWRSPTFSIQHQWSAEVYVTFILPKTSFLSFWFLNLKILKYVHYGIKSLIGSGLLGFDFCNLDYQFASDFFGLILKTLNISIFKFNVCVFFNFHHQPSLFLYSNSCISSLSIWRIASAEKNGGAWPPLAQIAPSLWEKRNKRWPNFEDKSFLISQ